MRTIEKLFARYAESHAHAANKAVHWVCVPLITWSLLALAWSASPVLAAALILAAVVFYAFLSLALAAGMLGVLVLMTYSLTLVAAHLAALAVAVFVLAWAGQFAGHAIEKRRPSFVDDVRFLLIGPAWLLAEVYRRLGIAW